MELSVKLAENVYILTLKGELDARTAPQLTRFFHEKITLEPPQVVADLKGLEYSSSAGIRAFLGMARETRHRGGDLRIAEVLPGVEKVFKLSKFDKIVRIFSSVEDAIDSFKSVTQ
jgi:anti-anti-sigma factor